MSIILTSNTCPEWMRNTVCDLWSKGFSVVSQTDLSALVEAKDRYEKFYLATIKDHATLHPRSQRDPAPVEQSDLPAPQHTEPGLEQKIRFLNKENAALLQSYLTLLHLYQLIK